MVGLSALGTRLPDNGASNRGRSAIVLRFTFVAIAIAVVLYLALVPLYYILHGTFTGPAGATLSNFSRAYGANSQAGQMMYNSVVFALGSAAVALVCGTALAFVQVRTDAPFKGLFFAASLVPLIVPGILYGIAWIFLADPKIGIINTMFLEPVLGFSVDVYSMTGMIFVQGFHLAPIAFMLMVAAFRVMDPSLEEAAQMSGASRILVLRRTTLPLLRPALISAALLIFVQSLESFEIPTILGLQHGTYVFTSRIYFELRNYPIDYGAAGAYAIGLLAVATIGVLISRWLGRNARNFQTVTGKAFRPRTVVLGRSRRFVGAGTILFFLITVVLPIVVLVYGSMLGFYKKPSLAAFKSMTLDNYRQVFESSLTFTALKNSFVLGISSATCVMVLTVIVAWFVIRTRVRGRGAVDVVAFTPLVIPGVVLGLALLFVYLRSSLPVYGTLLILFVAYVTRYLPYGMRYASSAMAQISTELEESATVFGATWGQTLRRVLFPLASGGIVAGWIYIFVVSFRELSSSILIYSPGNEVLSILMWEQVVDGQFTVLAAIGVLMIALLVVLVLIAYRFGAKLGMSTND